MVERALVFCVACAGHLAEMAGERAGAAIEEGGESGVELVRDGGGALEETTVEQADAELDVVLVEFKAFGDGVHRVAEAEAGVPEQANEFGEHGLEYGGLGFVLDQDEDVDVGAGEEFAASESADSENGEFAEGVECLAEGIGGEVFDEFRDAGEDGVWVGRSEEGCTELVPGGGGGEFLHGRR